MAHSENEDDEDKLHLINDKAEKQKGKSNGLQVELEEKLKTSETNLGLALERSNSSEKDIVKLKDELEKSLQWTKSSKLLLNVTNQSNFNKKGLGSSNITPPFNPHNKYVSERSSSQCWYMDSRCSKHMIVDIKNFLSVKALQGGGVSFGDGKKGYVLGVSKVGKSLGESIDNVYHVNGLKYSH
nr:uncharacterized protein LOC104647513 [Solanum lycopersicum]